MSYSVTSSKLYFLHHILALPDQTPDFPTLGYCQCCIMPVFPCIFIALRCAGGQAAVHTASTVWHRRGLARIAFSCPGLAFRVLVHSQFTLQGVVPHFYLTPHPPPGGLRCRQSPDHRNGRGHVPLSFFAALYRDTAATLPFAPYRCEAA